MAKAKDADAMESELLKKVIGVATAVTHERSFSRIFRQIVQTAEDVTQAEGGTLYIHDKGQQSLKAVVFLNTPLGTEHVYEDFDPVNVEGIIALPLFSDEGKPNHASIATACALRQELIDIPDLGADHGYDVSRVRDFDRQHNYTTKSMLAIPLFSRGDDIIGVLQLINPNGGARLSKRQLDFAQILALLLGAALSNSIYVLSFKNLIDSVVRMVSVAIDEKSPHTAGHCHRVTELALRLARAVSEHDEGVYADFRLSDADMHELEIAALLHDIGKIITPQHILDKSTKMEGIYDRIQLIEEKCAQLKHLKEIEVLRKKLADNGLALDEAEQAALAAAQKEVDGDLEFLGRVNTNQQFLDAEALNRLAEIAKRRISAANGDSRELINDKEHYNLTIRRGTLNPEERIEMENHVSITIRLLSSLPWPQELRRVTEYAGGHHENVNGTGYPNHLKGEDMSIPAKILSIVDRFEGLSAPDRPYKREMKLSKVLDIMGAMLRDNELDPEIYKIFLDRKVYLDYAKAHLPDHLIDVT